MRFILKRGRRFSRSNLRLRPSPAAERSIKIREGKGTSLNVIQASHPNGRSFFPPKLEDRSQHKHGIKSEASRERTRHTTPWGVLEHKLQMQYTETSSQRYDYEHSHGTWWSLVGYLRILILGHKVQWDPQCRKAEDLRDPISVCGVLQPLNVLLEIREGKGPSLGVIQPSHLYERSFLAPEFEGRSGNAKAKALGSQRSVGLGKTRVLNPRELWAKQGHVLLILVGLVHSGAIRNRTWRKIICIQFTCLNAYVEQEWFELSSIGYSTSIKAPDDCHHSNWVDWN